MGFWEPQENALRMKKKVERQPDGIPDARYPEKVERWQRRIPDVRCPGGMSAEKNSGCEISGWNVSGEEFQMRDIRMECRRREFRMRDIRVECRRGEFRMRDIRMECRRRRIPDVRHPGGMSYATRRKGAVCVSKGEGTTRQFLGRLTHTHGY